MFRASATHLFRATLLVAVVAFANAGLTSQGFASGKDDNGGKKSGSDDTTSVPKSGTDDNGGQKSGSDDNGKTSGSDDNGGGKPVSKQAVLKGKLLALQYYSGRGMWVMTLRVSNGSNATVWVSGSTNIQLNGASVALSALRGGDDIQANFDDKTLVTGVLLSTRVAPPPPAVATLPGTITAINVKLGTVTFVTSSKQVVTVRLSAATEIERNRGRGAMTSLRVGDTVQVAFQTQTGLAVALVAVGR